MYPFPAVPSRRTSSISAKGPAHVVDPITAHRCGRTRRPPCCSIDPDGLANPWHAAAASAIAFTLGALLPLAAILLAPAQQRVVVTAVIVLVALALAGWLSARIGASNVRVAVTRIVTGGAAGLALTYAIGRAFGTAMG